MPGILPAGSLLLLDACCVINLFATGRCEEILRRLPYAFATSRLIAKTEILSLAAGRPSAPSKREVIPSARLEDSDDIAVLDLRGQEEVARFVRFADYLDRGEASVCTLAVTRGGVVATDDRKTLSFLRRMTPQVPTIQTPEILWEWAGLSRVSDAEIGVVLRAVRDRARFLPRRNAPHFDWWERFLR